MDADQIKALINNALSLDELHVSFDGSQAKVIAVSDMFSDMSRVKKQQAVLAPLSAAIKDGSIHAVSVKTFTTEQWQRDKMFNLPI
ncbi:BolA family transcriptional regulator [Thalassotalea sp. LPB0316]|uniref:BolA family protein n=1 Tax=Thalassotalea sp. LPB0316 TaxID=2769490 RepID=UPI001865D8D2|nr:BolA family protein [Thalassotalea sp. LPB0316]QOL26908.1 BolA family transcriptional regulator [Thalassotalea sp. LPB0316]